MVYHKWQIGKEFYGISYILYIHVYGISYIWYMYMVYDTWQIGKGVYSKRIRIYDVTMTNH